MTNVLNSKKEEKTGKSSQKVYDKLSTEIPVREKFTRKKAVFFQNGRVIHCKEMMMIPRQTAPSPARLSRANFSFNISRL